MGKVCSQSRIEVVKKPPTVDIKYQEFKEENAEIFEIIEKLNPYKLFRLEEICYLYNNSFGTKKFLTSTEHDIFLDNKLLKNPIISEFTLNNTNEMTKFKDYSSKMCDILSKAFKTYYKEVTGDKYKGDLPFELFLALGILWGVGRTDVKRDFIFNYLSNKNGELILTNNVRFFLFSLFALPSCVSLFAYKMMADENEDYLKEIQKFDFEHIFSGYEVKDATNSTTKLVEYLFSGKAKLTYEEFKGRFEDRNCQSILTPNGIRDFISKHGI